MDSVEIVWRIPATLVMQNGRLLNYYLRRKKLVPPNGQIDKSRMASCINNGCNWCDLPRDLPPDATVYWHDKQWRAAAVLTELMHRWHQQVREQVKEIPMDNPNHH